MRYSIAVPLTGLILAFGVAGPGVAQEQLVTLRGGIWAIDPPDDFVVLTDPVAGFKHPSGAFIVVQDMPKAPVSLSFFDLSPDERKQVRVEDAAEVTVNGRRGVIAKLYIHAQRTLNIMLIVEGETSNGMISGLLPDSAIGKFSVEVLREALLTAVEQPKDILARLEDLPFVIGDTAGMRVATYAAGAAVLLTDGPLDDMEETADQAFAQIASVHNPPGERLDENTPTDAAADGIRKKFPDARITSSKLIETPEGYVLEARYERTIKAGKTVAGVMWLTTIGDRLVVMIGQYPIGSSDSLEKLAKVRAGFRSR